MGYCGIVCSDNHSITHTTIFINVWSHIVWHNVSCGSVAEISCACHWTYPSDVGCSRRAGLLCSEEASGRLWVMMYPWMRGWLCGEEVYSGLRAMMYCWVRDWLAGGPRWIEAADAGAVAGLSATGKRALLSGVVPSPRGIVAGQSGVVSSFLMCLVQLFLLDVFSSCSRWRMNKTQAKPSQNSNWGQRLAWSASGRLPVS